MKKTLPEMVVIVHNVRSAHNVGSIFRTADAAGITKIYLTGYTPAPLDRFNRPVKEIAKTALGAETGVSWEKVNNPSHVIAKLKRDGFLVVAVEQSARSKKYLDLKTKQPIALVLGNEVRGLSRGVLSHADVVVEIPMFGMKESLNVAVSFGIVAFGLRRFV
jgi:tRNA G18 (ribose-2'-O)-methylase SpoU